MSEPADHGGAAAKPADAVAGERGRPQPPSVRSAELDGMSPAEMARRVEKIAGDYKDGGLEVEGCVSLAVLLCGLAVRRSLRLLSPASMSGAVGLVLGHQQSRRINQLLKFFVAKATPLLHQGRIGGSPPGAMDMSSDEEDNCTASKRSAPPTARKHLQPPTAQQRGRDGQALLDGEIALVRVGPCSGCGGEVMGHVTRVTCGRCSSMQGARSAAARAPKRKRAGIFQSPTSNTAVSSFSASPQSGRLNRQQSEGMRRVLKSVARSAFQVPDFQSPQWPSKALFAGAEAQVAPRPPDDEDMPGPASAQDDEFESPERMRGEDDEGRAGPSSSTRAANAAPPKNRFERALKLVNTIKREFNDRPSIADSFVKILQGVTSGSSSALEAREALTALLCNEGVDEILQEAIDFLPLQEPQPFTNDMFERHSDPDVGDSGEDGGSRQQKKAKRPEYQIEGPGRRVRFDSEELDNLAKGVEKFGCGKWKEVLNFYKFNPCRTAVSLKDAWRTLENRRWREKREKLKAITPSKRGAFDPTPPSSAEKDLKEPGASTRSQAAAPTKQPKVAQDATSPPQKQTTAGKRSKQPSKREPAKKRARKAAQPPPASAHSSPLSSSRAVSVSTPSSSPHKKAKKMARPTASLEQPKTRSRTAEHKKAGGHGHAFHF